MGMMRDPLATSLVGLVIGAILLFSFGRDAMTPEAVPLAVVSGSENRALEPLILDWPAQNNLAPTITCLGSVDILREIAKAPKRPRMPSGPRIRCGFSLATRNRSSNIRNRSCGRRSFRVCASRLQNRLAGPDGAM